MITNDAFQFTPDLISLLVEAIPRLCRAKADVIDFFHGAGVPGNVLSDLRERLRDNRDSVNKFDIARTVLLRVNERGDACIRPRREIIRRVTGFEDYSTCWEGDILEAMGLVARIRETVNVKDAFTRIQIEKDRELSERLAASQARVKEQLSKRERLDAVKRDLFALFTTKNPLGRGKALEAVLNRLFQHSGILVREAFEVTGPSSTDIVEQIDGAIDLDGELYLVEMKWHKDKLGPREVNHHLSRVMFRGEARGIFISASEYTPGAIDACRKALGHRVVVLCT